MRNEHMNKKKQMILFGAGDEGVNALKYLPKGTVAFFTDNNSSRWGTQIQDIQIISPAEAFQKKISIYITPVGRYRREIQEQLNTAGILCAGFIQRYIAENYHESDRRLAGVKGIYSGKRCFIVGSGPSLRIQDLELLKEKGEITFASNRIFKIYEKTLWRPDLYCVTDLKLFKHYFDRICQLDTEYQFVVNIGESVFAQDVDANRLLASNKYIFNILKDYQEQDGIEWPRFSEDPSRYVVDGGITVTYAMLQWAYYLGFREVYLLGIDFDYGDRDGREISGKAHFIENYDDHGEEVNSPKLEESLKAYQVAKQFANTHPFKIYNATRGGRLEIFQRVNLDDLIFY